MAPKRKYTKISTEDKRRLTQCYEDDKENFANFCRTLGIPYKSAHKTVMKSLEKVVSLTKWGGKRFEKVTNEMCDFLLTKIEENPLLSLQDMRTLLQQEHSVTIGTSSISRHLKNMGISYKKCYQQPVSMDSEETKEKRKEFALKYINELSMAYYCVWVDETNIGVWSNCNHGRAKKGQRATILKTTSKGSNLNMILAISHDGVVHSTRKMGSYKKHEYNDFIQECCEKIEWLPNRKVAFIMDNASIHRDIDLSLYPHGRVFMLSPYSPQLNPIEETFSVIKHWAKVFISNHRQQLLQKPEGITWKVHKTTFLGDAMSYGLSKINIGTISNQIQHVNKYMLKATRSEDFSNA